MIKPDKNMNLTILRSTIAKQSIAQSNSLSPQNKMELEPGDYDVKSVELVQSNHYRVTFHNKRNGFYAWFVWGDDIKDNKPLINTKLLVPYYSQRDNDSSEWWRQCNTSTHAMLLNYLKPGSVASDDDYFQRFVKPFGDTTDWGVHTQALEKHGIDSVFRQNLQYSDLIKSLQLGYPVPIGVMHKGSLQNPSGGHVILIIGYDSKRQVFYANDSWGEGFSYTNYNGKGVEYPIYPSLDSRFLVGGQGWGRLILAIDGKRTGL